MNINAITIVLHNVLLPFRVFMIVWREFNGFELKFGVNASKKKACIEQGYLLLIRNIL